MAVTTYKKQEETAKRAGQQSYNGLAGVSKNTGRALGNYQAGYAPSQTVQQAQQTVQQVQAQKPTGYNSKYGAALDNILQQIQSPEKFKYEFNGDELFKQYADLYTQQGRQASMDAMGQAAGLTGGYGNSYAQGVGQQAYQQYLLGLYDRGMDLRDRAYQQYQDQQSNRLNAYSAMRDADTAEYGRYRDTVADWQAELERATAAERYEREFDYNDWAAGLDYYTQLAQIENADYRTEQERQEAIRQFNEQFAENRRQYDTSLAEQQRQYDTSMEENRRQYDTSFDEQVRQANLAEAYRRDQLAEQQRQYNSSLAEQQRQYNTDDAFRREQFGWQRDTDARDFAESQRQYNQSLAEQQRQANLDDAYRQAQLAEQQRQYNTSFDEQVRQANLDEAYRQAQLAEQQRQYNTSFDEQVRQADLDEAYRQATLAWQQETDARNYNEQVRQADLDEAYRNRAFNEQVRQADLDEAYRQATLAWQKETDQRDFAESQRLNDRSFDEQVREFDSTSELNWKKLEQDQAQYDANLTEKQRQYNSNMAKSYVTSILANGQVPSNELLVAAGLSLDDAKALMKQVATIVPKKDNGTGDDKGTGDKGKDMSYDQASKVAGWFTKIYNDIQEQKKKKTK